MLLITLLIAAMAAPDVFRGRGYVCVGILAAFIFAGFWTALTMPFWLGGMLTVGLLKALGVEVHAEYFGLKVITTPEPMLALASRPDGA